MKRKWESGTMTLGESLCIGIYTRRRRLRHSVETICNSVKPQIGNSIRDRDDEDDGDDDDDNNNDSITTITGRAKISNERDVRTRSKGRTRTRRNIPTTRREAYNVQYGVVYIFYISLFRILCIHVQRDVCVALLSSAKTETIIAYIIRVLPQRF